MNKWFSKVSQRRTIAPAFPMRHAVHIVQISHGGVAMFDRTKDFSRFLRELQRLKRHYGVRIAAYCLLPNAIHVLADAHGDAKRLLGLMDQLARWQVKSLYGDRLEADVFWSPHIDLSNNVTSDRLIHTAIGIEHEPVVRCLVQSPDDYPWSSWHAHTHAESGGLLTRRLVDDWPEYRAIAATDSQRTRGYRALAPDPGRWQRTLFSRAKAQDRLVVW